VRKTHMLSVLTAILLSVLAATPAMAACRINCGNGEECTGFPICCCVFDEFGVSAYCGPVAGNPCGRSAAASAEKNDLQASYAAIFSPATRAEKPVLNPSSR
jgi:hypothetical protein